MSFLAARIAATEGAYFLHESKLAAGRIAGKLPPSPAAARPNTIDTPSGDACVDVLPEILRHSIPIKAVDATAEPSLSESKWILDRSAVPHGASPDVLNPLSALVSLPQATFGPRRWNLPNECPAFAPSTANELRKDRYPPVDSEKLKAMASGISMIGKALAVATTFVFGGAAIIFYELQKHTTDDIRSKGKDILQPGVDLVRAKMDPLKSWAQNMSRKWHLEGETTAKEKPLVKELTKILGARHLE